MKTDHEKRACELFSSGCNCAQAVLTAFSDVTGLDEETSMRISSSFGAGMGRMREVCGTCSGMFMAAGLLYGLSPGFDDREKAAHYARIQELAAQFKEEHGSLICRELLKGLKVTSTPTPDARTEEYYKVRPCIRFVRTAVRILEKYLAEHPVSNTGYDKKGGGGHV
ncbi:MAG: C_GCAxxG_C_C family protein [Oscillospiraceae bacterium]|nr:C_GCAxxG_C_C family protein [Oscillospiraceae bacterium]